LANRLQGDALVALTRHFAPHGRVRFPDGTLAEVIDNRPVPEEA
jgi:hypothetical protein